MGHLAIFALGPLRIELDGQPLKTSRHKALALLVYLAMQPERQTREALAAFFWPEYGQTKAYAYLRRTIWELHSLLGENWLDVDRVKLGIRSDADFYLDVKRFQNHLADFNQHKHSKSVVCSQCVENLHKATLLYRGDFLSGFNLRDSADFDDWLFFQQDALRREYAGALEKLANLLLQKRSIAEAIIFGRRWLALDTLNEAAHRHLMEAFTLNGQRHIALHQYQECKRILQADLGIEPLPATKVLYETILSGKYTESWSFSNPSSQSNRNALDSGNLITWLGEALSSQETWPASSLPIPSTKFIGRQQELNNIANLLSDPACWLLTLHGPGGIGKTRLAIEIGQTQIANFPQGVFFVSLIAIESEQSIAPAIAQILGLSLRQQGTSPEEQLIDFLRDKHLLIILDSFEGLLRWSPVLAKFHSQAPALKLLVTSRHRLSLYGEWVLEVNGLDYPSEQQEKAPELELADLQAYGAIDLFLQSAYRSLATFKAGLEELKAISQIGRLLDGMPLGLELAATWVNILSCQEIVHEISRGMNILEAPLVDVPERQRSIRAVFDHSWNLLSSREKVLLPRLSVFRGSFTWQAAEQVAGIALRELSGLMDKSLVRRTPQERFDLHDLLRQYCAEKLARMFTDNLETNRRHCAYFSGRLVEWNKQLSSVKQGQALREIERELANILAAWEWAAQQKRWEYLEQAVTGLCMFYLRRARFAEGRITCQKAIDALERYLTLQDSAEVTRLYARLLTWQGVLNLNLEKLGEAEDCLYKCQQVLDDPRLEPHMVEKERIFSLVLQALIANLHGNPAFMLECYKQAIQLSRQTQGSIPSVLVYLWGFLMGGSVSIELYLQMKKNLTEVQQADDPFELACHLYVLGVGELFHFYRMEKAEALLQESIRNFKIVDDPATQVMISKTLGYLLLVKGNFQEALTLKRHELKINQVIGDRRMTGITQAEIGEILCHLGSYVEAEDQIRSAIALLKGRSDYEIALRHRYLGDVLLAQGKYDEARQAYHLSYHFFEARDEKGWMFTALTGLSRVEFALGKKTEAWRYVHQALCCYSEVQLYTFFAYLTIAEMALLMAFQGEIIRALELYSLVFRQDHFAKSRWFADVFVKFIEEAAVHVPFEKQAAAKKRGQEIDFSETVILLGNHLVN
jgi:DNA-binding SARP family transcriptional activator/predicted ATPase